MMDSWRSAFNDIGWFEWWKIPEPETSGFSLAVTELPGLKNLILPASDNFHSVFVHDWVFNRHIPYQWSFQQLPKKDCCLQHCAVPVHVAVKPSHSGIAQIGTGRVRDHQIPTVAQKFQNITLNVPARIALSRQCVAGK